MESNQTCYENGTSQETSNQNNMMYNSTPFLVLNSSKPGVNIVQNQLVNENDNYVSFQTDSGDLNSTKLLNGQFFIQNSQPIALQQTSDTNTGGGGVGGSAVVADGKNCIQMATLTPSQLQSLSYLMQAQIQSPQFLQTPNGIIQIVPQLTTVQNPGSTTNQDGSIQESLNALPTLGWSLNNFTNQLTLNQNNTVQGDTSMPQIIPVQQLLPNIYNQNAENDQPISSIVDLNVIENENKKPKRRKRGSKYLNDMSKLTSPSAQPTSTNEIKKELAESSSNQFTTNNSNNNNSDESHLLFDNKGRSFSFLCPECPKRFTLNSRLNAHMRCHTGMRPFTCTICGFSFTQKSYLIRHAAVHKEERPFNCEKCQKNYKHYGSLANHRKLHRKEDGGFCGEPYNGGGSTKMLMYPKVEQLDTVEQHANMVHSTTDQDDYEHHLVAAAPLLAAEGGQQCQVDSSLMEPGLDSEFGGATAVVYSQCQSSLTNN